MDFQEGIPEVDPNISIDLLHLSKTISRGIFFFPLSGKLWIPNRALARLQKSWSHRKYPLAILKPKKRRDQHNFLSTDPWLRWILVEMCSSGSSFKEGFSLDFPLLEITSSWSSLLVLIQAKSSLILICGFYFLGLGRKKKTKIPQMWSQSGSIISGI